MRARCTVIANYPVLMALAVGQPKHGGGESCYHVHSCVADCLIQLKGGDAIELVAKIIDYMIGSRCESFTEDEHRVARQLYVAACGILNKEPDAAPFVEVGGGPSQT